MTKGLPLVPVGIAVTALSVPLTLGLGALSRRMAELLLRHGPVPDVRPRSRVPAATRPRGRSRA